MDDDRAVSEILSAALGHLEDMGARVTGLELNRPVAVALWVERRRYEYGPPAEDGKMMFGDIPFTIAPPRPPVHPLDYYTDNPPR